MIPTIGKLKQAQFISLYFPTAEFRYWCTHKIIFRYLYRIFFLSMRFQSKWTCISFHFQIAQNTKIIFCKYLSFLTSLSWAAKSISLFIEIDLPIAGSSMLDYTFRLLLSIAFEYFSNISYKFFIHLFITVFHSFIYWDWSSYCR